MKTPLPTQWRDASNIVQALDDSHYDEALIMRIRQHHEMTAALQRQIVGYKALSHAANAVMDGASHALFVAAECEIDAAKKAINAHMVYVNSDWREFNAVRNNQVLDELLGELKNKQDKAVAYLECLLQKHIKDWASEVGSQSKDVLEGVAV